MRANLSWILLAAPLLVHAAEPLKLQRAPMPNPPWPAGDERGMANQIGSATWNRCAWHMTLPGAQAYELSQIRSNTMPLSPFAGPYAMKPKTTAGKGQPMKAGEVVTAKHIEEMLKAQGLGFRGILAGDVVYVHTGWGDHWRDPDTEKFYYSKAPGLSYDGARYLADKRIVAIGLDTPFIDAVPEGMLAGKGAPAEGTPPALPFAVHHHMLTQAGDRKS